MNELRGLTVRDLIAALAEAEDTIRGLRRSAASGERSEEDLAQQLAALAEREDVIVAELRRREAVRNPCKRDPQGVAPLASL